MTATAIERSMDEETTLPNTDTRRTLEANVNWLSLRESCCWLLWPTTQNRLRKSVMTKAESNSIVVMTKDEEDEDEALQPSPPGSALMEDNLTQGEASPFESTDNLPSLSLVPELELLEEDDVK